jgi:hypothetical protein
MIALMRGSSISLRTWSVLALGLFTYGTATPQDPEPAALYSTTELEELVGPVALYPDDLLAIVLPASAYPLQLVQAQRFLEDHEQDPDLEPNEDWDDAVVALLNYPEIVDYLNEDLDWTWTLGEAVVNQQPEIMDAIQKFRERAYAAGNLESDDHQIVRRDDGVIEIERAEPEVIYVPYYEPERVVVYQSAPAYYYYPFARPVYYYPYPAHYRFASGFFWGVTTAYVFSWLTDGLYAHHYGHVSHPYYGYTYRHHFYTRHHVYDHRDRYTYGDHYTTQGRVWRAGYKHGARPRHIDAPRIPAPRHSRRTIASNFSNPRIHRQTSVQRMPEIRAPEARTVNRRATRLSRDRVAARTDRRAAGGRPAARGRSDTRISRVDRSGSASAGGNDRVRQGESIRTSRRSGQSIDTSGSTRRVADTKRQRVAVNTQRPVSRAQSPQSRRTPAPNRSEQARHPGAVKSTPISRQSNRSHSNRSPSNRSHSGRSNGPSDTRHSGGGSRGRATGGNSRGLRG